MSSLKNFFKIINIHTLILLLLTFLATIFCIYFNININIPFDLIGIAIIFPIVFSINAAYSRREKALEYYASIKSSSSSLFFAFKTWNKNEVQIEKQVAEILLNHLKYIKLYFSHKKDDTQYLLEINSSIYSLNKLAVSFRDAGVSPSEMTVIYRFIASLNDDFEKLKNIFVYRTPVSLRAYSKIFLNAFPLLFAPYFAFLSIKQSYILGFMVGSLYGLILASLDNIQSDMENPFDQIGTDDLNLDGEEYFQNVISQSNN